MDMAASVKEGKEQETDIPYGEQGSLNEAICLGLAFNKDVSVKSGKCNLDRNQHQFWTTALGFYAWLQTRNRDVAVEMQARASLSS